MEHLGVLCKNVMDLPQSPTLAAEAKDPNRRRRAHTVHILEVLSNRSFGRNTVPTVNETVPKPG